MLGSTRLWEDAVNDAATGAICAYTKQFQRLKTFTRVPLHEGHQNSSGSRHKLRCSLDEEVKQMINKCVTATNLNRSAKLVQGEVNKKPRSGEWVMR